MKKLYIGMIVREGGLKGPISKIIGFKNGFYVVEGLEGRSIGYVTADYLYPYIPSFVQLDLFESSL